MLCPIVEGTDFEKVPVMESDISREAVSPEARVHEQPALGYIPLHRVLSPDCEVGRCDVQSGFGLESSSLGSKRTFGCVGM